MVKILPFAFGGFKGNRKPSWNNFFFFFFFFWGGGGGGALTLCPLSAKELRVIENLLEASENIQGGVGGGL